MGTISGELRYVQLQIQTIALYKFIYLAVRHDKPTSRSYLPWGKKYSSRMTTEHRAHEGSRKAWWRGIRPQMLQPKQFIGCLNQP